MEIVTAIVKKRGGWNSLLQDYIRVENEPFFPLVIEYIGEGPTRRGAISVAQYGKLNGDAMRDPEMCFEIVLRENAPPKYFPYYYRNDYLGKEFWTYDKDLEGDFMPGTLNEIRQQLMIQLMGVWDAHLNDLGFLEMA